MLIRLAILIVWLNFSRFLLWNAGSTLEGEWLVWAGDWLECGGRFHVAAMWDREGCTFTLVDDSDKEYEAECWEWRLDKVVQKSAARPAK